MDIDPNNNNNTNSYPPSLTTPAYPSSFAGYNNNNNNNNNNYYVAAPLHSSIVPHPLQPAQPMPFGPTTDSSTIMNQAQQIPIFGLIIPGCRVRTDFVPMIDTNNPSLPVTKYSLNVSCSTDLNNVPLLSITELVLFVTSATPVTTAPVAPIPPNYGVLCYWQITEQLKVTTTTSAAPEATGFALFGALTSTQPSAIYRTGWSEHEQLVTMVQKLSSSSPTMNHNDLILTIGLSIEPIQNVQNILGGSNNVAATPMSSMLPGMSISASMTSMQDVGGIMNQAINSQTTNSRLYVAQKIALDLFHFMQSFDTPTNNQGTANNMMMVPTNIFDRWYQRFENRYRRDPNFFLKKSD
jgi:Protein of unknown function (DUF775)